MKFIKKALSLVMALVLTFSCASASFAVDAADLIFQKVNGEYYRLSFCSPYATGDLVIPSVYNGLPVKEISASAFENSCLESVTIPSSIETIRDKAFYNSSVKTIEFKGNDLSLGSAVFSYCLSLTSITLPSQLKRIPDNSFFACEKLKSISIPSTVTYIGVNAFNCSGLTSVFIPASVTSIGTEAFAACQDITAITVDGANEKFKSVDGVLFTKDGTKLLQYPCACETKIYTVPDGTETISKTSFAKTSDLQIIYFADSVKTVEAYAFSECKALSGVFFNDSIETLEALSFQRCSSFREVIIPASIISFNSAFYLSGLITVTIEDGVEEISASAFDSCSSLKNITIPESVTSIESGAFKSCSALDCLNIPATVTDINKNAFVDIDDKIVLEVESGSEAHSFAQENLIKFKIGDLVYCFVTFDADEGTFEDGSKTKTVSCPVGEPIPVISGVKAPGLSTFKGWSPAFPPAMISENLTFYATYGYICPDCDDEFINEDDFGYHLTIENARKNSSISIKNNTTGSKTINYGETLRLTAIIANDFEPKTIIWYVDGEKADEGNTFDISFKEGTKSVTVKLADKDGNIITDSDGNEISSGEDVSINSGIFQKIISFFKDLFRINRLVIQ